MAITVTTGDGVTFNIPEQGDANWGEELCNYLVHMAGASFSGYVTTTTRLNLSAYNGTLTNGAIIHSENGSFLRLSGYNGAVTANATQPLNNGTQDGQYLVIAGGSAVNTITIPDSGNVDIRGPITLGLNSVLTLIWSSVAGKWIEISRNN